MDKKRRWQWIKEPEKDLIPADVQEQTRQRVLAYGEKILPAGRASWLRVRYRKEFCYIEAIEPGDPVPTHLARLRWRGDPDGWEVAFYVYSRERYQICAWGDREWGTPEEALKLGAGYLGAPLLG